MGILLGGMRAAIKTRYPMGESKEIQVGSEGNLALAEPWLRSMLDALRDATVRHATNLPQPLLMEIKDFLEGLHFTYALWSSHSREYDWVQRRDVDTSAMVAEISQELSRRAAAS